MELLINRTHKNCVAKCLFVEYEGVEYEIVEYKIVENEIVRRVCF